MRMIYASQGNIPSKWAHTFQAMKMAEALAKLVDDFQLVTQIHWSSFLGKRFDYEEWYGIRRQFKITGLPTWKSPRRGLFAGWRYPRFDKMAALYAVWKKADLVYTRSPYAGRLCVKHGLKTVIEFHDALPHVELHHVLAVKSNKNLLGIVTITEELKEAQEQAGIPAGKIFVWPDAVDLGAFEHLPDKTALRQRFGLSQESFIATYCGHLYPDRGIEDILQCAAAMPHILFYVVGGWEKDVASRKNEAKKLSNVLFSGFVSNRQIPKYLVASDVLLMPYSTRCQTASWMSPMKLFEYMASKRPIIATDLPALKKHLKHGRNALLIQPDDPDELAKAIETVRLNPTYAAELANAAYTDVLPYTWDSRARAIMAHFAG